MNEENKLNDYFAELTKTQEIRLTNSFVNLMRENPDMWGSTDFDFMIDIELDTVETIHNTITHIEDNQFFSKQHSLYSFDTDGWFDYDYETDEYSIIGTVDEWLGSEMFTIQSIKDSFVEEY